MESRENMMPVDCSRDNKIRGYIELSIGCYPNNPTATNTDSPSPMMDHDQDHLGFRLQVVKCCLLWKKRGKPRKYGPDGVPVNGGVSGTTLSPLPLSYINSPASGGYSDIKFDELAGSGSEFQAEKKRIRRMGSSKKSSMSLVTLKLEQIYFTESCWFSRSLGLLIGRMYCWSYYRVLKLITFRFGMTIFV